MPIEPPSDHPSGSKRVPRLRLGWGRNWLNVRRKRFWVLVLFLAYLLAGYGLLPLIARREIVALLQEDLQRPVSLEAVRMNPLILSADLRGLRIGEKDGSPLVGFDRFHFRFSLASLPHRAWTFDDVELEGLTGSVVRFSENDSNIGRLIQALDKPGAPPRPEAAPGLPRLEINHLRILNAAADYMDRTLAHPFHTRVGPVTVEINRLSTLPRKTGEQHIQIALEGGATLELTSTTGLNPLVSTGHVTARGPYVPLLSRYFADALKMQAPTGTVAADLDYRLQTRPDGGLGLVVEHIGFALNDLTVREQGREAPFLTVPEFRLKDGHLAWPEKQVGAEAVSITGMTLAMRRQADGGIAPAPWAAPVASSAPPAVIAPDTAPAASSPASPAWAVSLGKFDIKTARVKLEDRTPRQPTTLEITPVDLAIETLSSQPGAAFPFSLAVGVASGGEVKAQGRVTVLPDFRLDAKVAVSDLRLAVAQPYLRDLARVSIDDGRFNGVSEVKIQGADGLILSGQGEVMALKVQDEVTKAPLVSWDRLAVDHYDYRQARNDLQISQVTIGGPYLRFQVAADQSTNFTHLMVASRPPAAARTAPSAAGNSGAASPAPPMQAPMTAPKQAPMKVSVGRIVVSKGAADYGDASLPLPFAAHITDLQGEVATLTSAMASPTRVALRGQVGEFGQATIAGTLTPFDPGRSTKVSVLFRNVEFPGLSPYTVKFAGRRIARGRLDVDLRYLIDDGRLNGANRVVIRDIELGQKLDVPGALNLPLELAIALLKDEDGKINVDLPVSGNLNDPQFDIGGVISQAVSSLLTNLISAPFEALAGLFGGGGQTLDHIDFAPGRADLDPPEREKILHLAQALAMRPHLALVVPGVIDPQADQEHLRLSALDARIAHDLGDRDTVKRQRQMLESLFEARVGKDQLPALKQGFIHAPDDQGGGGTATLDEAAYVAALRERVAAAEPLAPTALADLAQARAAAVVDALKLAPGFDPRRVSLRGSATVRMGDDGTIPLKLDAESAGGGQ